jgi:hypothetical protein
MMEFVAEINSGNIETYALGDEKYPATDLARI